MVSLLRIFQLHKYSLFSVAELCLCAVTFLRPGPSHVLQVADALCLQLSSSDLLGDEGGDVRGERGGHLLVPSSGRQTGSVGPLIISC